MQYLLSETEYNWFKEAEVRQDTLINLLELLNKLTKEDSDRLIDRIKKLHPRDIEPVLEAFREDFIYSPPKERDSE